MSATDGQAQTDGLVRIGTAANALGVSTDTLRRWERAGQITFERRGTTRYIAKSDLALLLRKRSTFDTSDIPNRLPGTIIDITYDGVLARVELACGPYRILSLIPRTTAEALNLQPGSCATAILNATSVEIDARTA